MMIRLEGAAMADVATTGSPNGPDDVGLETASALSDGAGRFTFLGVPAGENGRLLIDQVGPVKRELIKRKLRKDLEAERAEAEEAANDKRGAASAG